MLLQLWRRGHAAVNCPAYTDGFCTAQKVHVSTDEYKRAGDGDAYNPYSDYYDTYNVEIEECKAKSQHGFYSLMLRVMDDSDH